MTLVSNDIGNIIPRYINSATYLVVSTTEVQSVEGIEPCVVGVDRCLADGVDQLSDENRHDRNHDARDHEHDARDDETPQPWHENLTKERKAGETSDGRVRMVSNMESLSVLVHV